MNALLTSAGFLRFGGIVLLLVGVAGLVGIPGQSFWAFTDGEDIAHLALGIVGVGAGFGLKNAGLHRLLTIVVFATAIVFALWGLILPSGGAFTAPDKFATPNFYGLANLESPMDSILHLVVAVWSGLALWMERRAPALAAAPQSR
ncbi:MAG: hypothetical protein HYU87_03795 [Chloroflexi bacterium]|nr:hypothetical protein [Chloroflexota bacterium]